MPNKKRFTSNAVTTAANGAAIVIMFVVMITGTASEQQQLRATLEQQPLQFFTGRCTLALTLVLISTLCVSLIKILFKNMSWDHQQKTIKQLVLRTLYFFLAAGVVSVLYCYYYLYYVVLP